MTGITYLHIQGLLEENFIYCPRRGYESAQRGRQIELNQDFQLVLLDANGRVLLTEALEVKGAGCGFATGPLTWRVRGLLPVNPAGAAYELRKREVLVYRAEIPAAPPKAATPQHNRNGSTISLTWNPVEQGDAEVTYSVLAAMESGRRLTLADDLTANAYSIDLNSLPIAGKGTLYLRTNDGVRSSEVEAGSIDVPVRPPVAYILSPEVDARLPFGYPVSVLGSCLAMDGRPCAPEGISWLIDGKSFARGTNVVALQDLSPGAHRLTLAYRGANETTSVQTSLTVQINEPTADYKQWEMLTREYMR